MLEIVTLIFCDFNVGTTSMKESNFKVSFLRNQILAQLNYIKKLKDELGILRSYGKENIEDLDNVDNPAITANKTNFVYAKGFKIIDTSLMKAAFTKAQELALTRCLVKLHPN